MATVKYNLGNLSIVPSGSVIPFAGINVPQGYLLCDGSEVSRTDYSYLFNVIGTTYGEGDGSTTFNLPNLQDKFVQGSGTNVVGTEMSAGLPNITGKFGNTTLLYDGSSATGAFSVSKGSAYSNGIGNNSGSSFSFNASSSSTIYGNSNTVQPPAIVMNYIIKY